MLPVLASERARRDPRKHETPPILAGFAFDRGAGGIRTLVQTSNDHAFYMLSFCLIVGAQLTKNRLLRT